MLRATRVLLSKAPKLSTGIVGLDVVPNAREVLMALYARTLEEIKIIPEGVPYREQVEKFTKYRLKVVQDNEDVGAIETEINYGQVEQLIEAAKGELELIPAYASWKLWEQAPPAANDAYFEDTYKELERLDGKLEWHSGLQQLKERKSARDAAEKAAAAKLS